MCWSNYIAIPLVLKKPLRVYKVGLTKIFGNFISLFQGYVYHKCQAMPTIEINPEFTRRHLFVPGYKPQMWDTFYIHEGYHSYLTEEMAKCNMDEYDDIGIFEIPAGSTVYINFRHREVVSTNIRYLGPLKE